MYIAAARAVDVLRDVPHRSEASSALVAHGPRQELSLCTMHFLRRFNNMSTASQHTDRELS